MESLAVVSTHSRPKAAGTSIKHKNLTILFQHTAARRRLAPSKKENQLPSCFNTQPPEGGWHCLGSKPHAFKRVSTHSRPKAAGCCAACCSSLYGLFQHTAARRRLAPPPADEPLGLDVSTHSRPKAAGQLLQFRQKIEPVSTHSRPKAAGKHICIVHTCIHVSTHSRPKAAGVYRELSGCTRKGFNTQPPEGGWHLEGIGNSVDPLVSTHSRPKAAGHGFAFYTLIC